MNHIASTTAFAGILLLLGACERPQGALVTSPNAEPLRLEEADVQFRLSAGDRTRLARGFDADALERLLREVRPDMRGEILSYFQIPAAGERKGQLIEIHDPRLQAILEEVWAPMWDDAPDAAIEEGWYAMPGREVARERRRARTRDAQRPQQQP